MIRLDQDGQSEPLIELPEEQWREIEAAIGIKEPTLPFRTRISCRVALVIEQLGPRAIGEVGGPHLAVVRDHLDKLTKQAQRLADTLAKLRSEAESGDADADRALYLAIQSWAMLIHKDYPDLWRAIAPQDRFADFPEDWKDDLQGRLSLCHFPRETETLAITAVSQLAAASEAAIQTLTKSKGGAPKDADLDELICTLAISYWDETGSRPSVTWHEHDNRYSGKFLRFFLACCQAFAPAYALKSNSALGKAAQRALKKLPVSL